MEGRQGREREGVDTEDEQQRIDRYPGKKDEQKLKRDGEKLWQVGRGLGGKESKGKRSKRGW